MVRWCAGENASARTRTRLKSWPNLAPIVEATAALDAAARNSLPVESLIFPLHEEHAQFCPQWLFGCSKPDVVGAEEGFER